MVQPHGDPLEGLLALGRDIDRYLKNFFAGNASLTQHSQPSLPAIEVLDTSETIVVRAQVPGIQKNDLHLVVNDESLTLKGDMKAENPSPEVNVYQCEFRYGSFSRRIVLPAVVDSDRATAKLSDGILTIVLPKRSETQGRNVSIQ